MFLSNLIHLLDDDRGLDPMPPYPVGYLISKDPGPSLLAGAV